MYIPKITGIPTDLPFIKDHKHVFWPKFVRNEMYILSVCVHFSLGKHPCASLAFCATDSSLG